MFQSMALHRYMTPVMYLDITGKYTIFNYHIIGEFPDYSRPRVSFDYTYYYSEITDVVPRTTVIFKGLYFEGGLDLFSGPNSLTLAHLSVGVLSTRFIT